MVAFRRDMSTERRTDGFADDDGGGRDGLRKQIASVLLARADVVTADTVAIFPFSGVEALDADYCHRIGQLLVQLLAFGVRDGRLEPRDRFVADLYQVALDRAVAIEQLFTFAYLVERTALDELALDEAVGASSESWPIVAQLVRRASFDLLAAYTARSQIEPRGAAITDRLTTLFTRPVFDAALAKAIDRGGRFGDPLSLILFDVDHLAAINANYGYGVGDRILERLGILIRRFFRQHDWVARHSEDSIAVLLVRTEPGPAAELADRVLATVQERLELTDHRTDQPVRVTLSASIINVVFHVGDAIAPEQLMADAEIACEKAKQAGRNRVERIDGYPGNKPPTS